jgi:hypothetical protein
MANRTSGNRYKDNPSGLSGVKIIILIMPIIAFIALVWLILFRLDQIPESMTFNLDFETWMSLWTVILLLVLVILACIPQTGKRSMEKTTGVSSKPRKPTAPKDSTAKKSEEKPLEFVPLGKGVGEEPEIEPETTLKLKPEPVTSEEKALKVSEPESVKEDETTPESTAAALSGIKDKSKSLTYVYPSDVDGGLYGDTFIELDSDSILKLRVLVVKDIYLM